MPVRYEIHFIIDKLKLVTEIMDSFKLDSIPDVLNVKKLESIGQLRFILAQSAVWMYGIEKGEIANDSKDRIEKNLTGCWRIYCELSIRMAKVRIEYIP